MRRILPIALLALAAACSGGDSPSAPVLGLTLETSATEFSSTVSALVLSVPSVTVRDSHGKAAAGVLVRWTVLAGGGHIANDTARTNSAGVATSGGWTLGPQAGEQKIQASIGSASPVIFTATALVAAPTRLVRVTTAVSVTTVGTAIAQAIAVRAEDASGNPAANVSVHFSVEAGGGSIEGAEATTDSRGIATSGAWMLGTSAGTQTVRATSSGLASADIDVIATAAAPSSLVLLAGDDQTGVSGSPVAQPPIVRVRDVYGNNVGNVSVTFTPGSGSGSVTGGTVLTDAATGTAAVSSWTLGTAAAQTLVASTTALPGQSVTFRAAVTLSQFDIEVRFIGDGGTDRQRQAFASAVTRWRRVITGDIGTTALNAPAGECASWLPAIKENVNDLLIFVRLTNIDGPGKVLGQASPCYVNSTNRLPMLGFFELDVDDLTLLNDRGTLDDVVLHEMGHILGVGTLWTYQRTLLTGRGTDDPYFNGPATREQFASIGGLMYSGTPVPVENTGAAGTRDAHWRRTVFVNELMQGYAQPGGMPMSRVTVASLSDLGYTVSFTGSDGFNFFPSMRTLPAGEAVPLGDDVVDSAIWEVQPSGLSRRMKQGTERR